MHIVETLESIKNEKNKIVQAQEENKRTIQRLEGNYTRQDILRALSLARNVADQDIPTHLCELVVEYIKQERLEAQHSALVEAFWSFIEYADLIDGMREKEDYLQVKMNW